MFSGGLADRCVRFMSPISLRVVMYNDRTPIWIKRRIQRLIDKGVDASLARKSLSRIEGKIQKAQKDAKLAGNVILFPSVINLRLVEIITA